MPAFPPHAPPRKNNRAIVRLSGVTKRFGTKTAVDSLDLTITEKCTFGLIGPNGAGKTTTFALIAGFVRPTNGAVEVMGQEPHRVSALRGRLGVLPQDALLPPHETVEEFLTWMALLQGIAEDDAHRTVHASLESIGGLSWKRVRCSALSHGMAKRVQIAQALLGNPALVLLDEPTAGLDPRSAYEIRELLRARKAHSTIILSSHNIHEIEDLCDSAAILDQGRLASVGEIQSLTGASEQIIVTLNPGPAPIEHVNSINGVDRVEWQPEALRLTVFFSPRDHINVEFIMAEVMQVLLQHHARLREISAGSGLERAVVGPPTAPNKATTLRQR